MILSIFLYVLVMAYFISKKLEDYEGGPVSNFEKLDFGVTVTLWPLVMIYEISKFWIEILRKKIGGE